MRMRVLGEKLRVENEIESSARVSLLRVEIENETSHENI